MMTKRETASFAAYAIVGLLTFGSMFNARYSTADCGPEPDILESSFKWNQWRWCVDPDAFIAAFPAIFAGAAWPVYWAGRGAIWITATEGA